MSEARERKLTYLEAEISRHITSLIDLEAKRAILDGKIERTRVWKDRAAEAWEWELGNG